jgi:DNA-binding beta-propeller fold protein YncE
MNHRVQKFTGTGGYLAQWGSLGSDDGQFNEPLAVTTDANGDVYVVNLGNSRVQMFSETGAYLAQWGSSGPGDGEFHEPSAVATDATGNVYVYVVDRGNNRVQKFGPGAVPAASTSWGRIKALYR